MSDDTAMPAATVAAMVRAVAPGASVETVEPAEDGHLAVYHVTAATSAGPRDWVLKASPDDERHGVDAEARLLSLVGERTSIPVPRVVGVVDAHETLPAPFFVMTAAEGQRAPKRAIGTLSDDAVERVARESGRYLADLHAVADPEGYGVVDVARTATLSGARPSVDPDQVTVRPLQGESSAAGTSWPAVLREWTGAALDRHAETRFGDLTPALRTALDERIDALSGPFSPVLGRVDHDLQNLLLDRETGSITAVIDWGFTLSVPPAYDLACVAANLSAGPWSVHPDAPDRRESIRAALLDGYASAVVEQYRDHGGAYDLLALVRGMTHLAAASETSMPGATDAAVDAAAAAYRDLVAERLA